nr:unnamed protein product [Digitaria exilis]
MVACVIVNHGTACLSGPDTPRAASGRARCPLPSPAAARIPARRAAIGFTSSRATRAHMSTRSPAKQASPAPASTGSHRPARPVRPLCQKVASARVGAARRGARALCTRLPACHANLLLPKASRHFASLRLRHH